MPVPLLEKDRKNSQGLTEAGVCLKWGSVGRNDDLKYVCINFVTRLGEHTGGWGGGGEHYSIWLVPVCGTEQGVVFTLNLKQGIKFHYQISWTMISWLGAFLDSL